MTGINTHIMAEETNEKLRIKLHIYDTDIPVNVRPEDEPMYRDVGTLVTGTINTYAARYKGTKSDKEILYMSLIEIALRYEMERSRNDTVPYRDIISQLTSEIEDTLAGK